MTPLLIRSPSTGSNQLVMLNAFCWPGVGARKPVLTPARTKPTRADTLPLSVVPKSSNSSTRTAVPTVQSSSMSVASTSA